MTHQTARDAARAAVRAKLAGPLFRGGLLDAVANEIADAALYPVLGDDSNPSSLVTDAQAYRYLADGISATMTDQNVWDGDDAEETILLRYVQHLAAHTTGKD